MPLYEYKCTHCETNVELRVRSDQRDLQLCPKCKKALQRKMSQTTFVLKGGGWASDGYSG